MAVAGKMKILVTWKTDKALQVSPEITLAELKRKVAEKFNGSESDVKLKKKEGDKWVLLTENNFDLKDNDKLEVTKKLFGPVMKAIIPRKKLWMENGKIVENIRVFFMNDPPRNVLYKGQAITKLWIMSLIENQWDCSYITNADGTRIGQYVPRFQMLNEPDYAHIRVLFKTGDGSFSVMATAAKSKSVEDATMVLDLEETDLDIPFTIVHEFGHVFGLYHEHQHPQYVEVMEKYVDDIKVMELSGIEDTEDYIRQFKEPEDAVFKYDYDFESIMHYPTSLESLYDEYQGVITDYESLNVMLADGRITEQEYKILYGFVNHVNHVKTKPSHGDKKGIAEAYYDEHIKLNPPPAAVPIQTPDIQPPQPNVPPPQPILSAPQATKRYLGKTAPSLRDLSMVRNPKVGPPFRLKRQITEQWRDMGITLGLEDIINNFKHLEPEERVERVLKKWIENAANLADPERYAYSWDGLDNLLQDVGYGQVANEYFSFLEKCTQLM